MKLGVAGTPRAWCDVEAASPGTFRSLDASTSSSALDGLWRFASEVRLRAAIRLVPLMRKRGT